jgi:alpha-amylase
MPPICLYAQVHQPYRLRRFRLFDIGSGVPYFDDEANARILRRVADKCYIPANRLLTDLIRRSDADFRIALSLTGTLVEQLVAWAPDALASFQELVDTGRVELLGETYYHSLASLANEEEFVAQVERHRAMIRRWFDREPTVFRNTELIYWDGLAPAIARLGFQAAMVEGADQVLGWRSPNFVYEAAAAPGLRLLPRNYRLSDDVGFRFSQREWDGWPVTADKYAGWVADSPGESVHLYVDYETFGEHQWQDTGIFDFLAHLPRECARRGLRFVHPSDLASRPPVGQLSFERPTSWADVERDTTAWLGNRLQYSAHERLYGLRQAVWRGGDPDQLEAWRRLTTSDHVYYMCTKWFADGDVHKYFSPYDSPYDAFVAFMNVSQDLEQATERPLGLGAGEGWLEPAGMAVVA